MGNVRIMLHLSHVWIFVLQIFLRQSYH